ncbi:MAG: DUF718 domain-containing protein [Hyphomicrobiaceae bacterium]
MTAFNIVKFKVKSGQEQAFLEAHAGDKARWPGLVRGTIIKTGEGTYCLIGEWQDLDALIAARPAMIDTLNSFRALLDDQGEGKGITDAVSGEVALTIA